MIHNNEKMQVTLSRLRRLCLRLEQRVIEATLKMSLFTFKSTSERVCFTRQTHIHIYSEVVNELTA